MAEEDSRHNLIFYIGLGAIFLPWIYLQSFIRIPADAAWLISAAEHILNGQALTQYYFDTNPPLCFIIFMPMVFLGKLGFETWQALQIYTGLLSVLSLGLCAYFLERWPISKAFRQVFLLFYAIGLFCVPFLEYGQKDHLIGVILMPFLLAQLGITYKYNQSKAITLLTFILFVPFILTKPHYGLLPTAVLLHRLYARKSLRVILDADFIVLAIGTILYVAATAVFFPDFIEQVLPLSLPLYVNQLGNPNIHKFSFAMMFLGACVIMLAAVCEKKSGERTLSLFMGVFAMLAVIPYWVQLKGFSLHLIPFNILAVTAMGAAIGLYLHDRLAKNLKVFLAALLALSVGVCALIYNHKDSISHEYYRSHELAKILKPTGAETSFYIESNSTTTALQMAEYLDMEFASRFVANWFTFNLVELPEESRNYYWQLLGDYYAEDLDRYKPETVLFIHNDEYYTALNTFKEHENFQKALSAYRQNGEYKTDEIFMSGEEILGVHDVPYYVYRRTENN